MSLALPTSVQTLPDADQLELEWRVMELIWGAPHTAAEIWLALRRSDGLSRGQVRSLLVRLVAQDYLEACKEAGRRRRYRSAVRRKHCVAAASGDFLQRVFQGDRGRLLRHFIRQGGFSGAECRELQELLEQATAEETGDDPARRAVDYRLRQIRVPEIWQLQSSLEEIAACCRFALQSAGIADLRIVIQEPGDPQQRRVPCLKLRNGSLATVLARAAEQCGMALYYDPQAVVLRPVEWGEAPRAGQDACAASGAGAWLRAAALTLPGLDFMDRPLAEAVGILDRVSVERGGPRVMLADASAEEAQILLPSLDLASLPLSQTLGYLAEIAGRICQADEQRILLC